MTRKLSAVLLAFVMLAVPRVDALGTSFLYQGGLIVSGAPATGQYDLEFGLFAASSGGTAIATIVKDDVYVGSPQRERDDPDREHAARDVSRARHAPAPPRDIGQHPLSVSCRGTRIRR